MARLQATDGADPSAVLISVGQVKEQVLYRFDTDVFQPFSDFRAGPAQVGDIKAENVIRWALSPHQPVGDRRGRDPGTSPE